MSTTNPPRITKHILPEQYYGAYESPADDGEKQRRGGFNLLRFFWFGSRD